MSLQLSKTWTLKALEDVIRNLVNEIAPDKVQSLSFVDYLNLATSDVAEMLSSASQPDYGVTDVQDVVGRSLTSQISVSESNKETKSLAVGSVSELEVGNTVFITTTDDSGSVTSVLITKITAIDVPGVQITVADLWIEYTGDVFVWKVPDFSNTLIDMNELAYSVDKVIKVVSSTNGLVIPVKDYEFENVLNLSQYKNSIVMNQFGNILYFKKGASVSTYGQMTVCYYRQPIPMSADGDYIDIRDKYVSLVLAKAKNYIYEQVGVQAPEALTNQIDARTQAIRALNLEENATIKGRQTTAKGQ